MRGSVVSNVSPSGRQSQCQTVCVNGNRTRPTVNGRGAYERRECDARRAFLFQAACGVRAVFTRCYARRSFIINRYLYFQRY